MDPIAREHPLQPVIAGWLRTFYGPAREAKQDFDDIAKEAMMFFCGDQNEMWNKEYASGPRGYLAKGSGTVAPEFRMTLAKIAEVVQLFGPFMYSQNPIRHVTPRRLQPIDPSVLLTTAGGAAGGPGGMLADPMQAQMYGQFLAMTDAQQTLLDTTRADLISDYLNYTPNELNLKKQIRMAATECLVKGMSCIWTEVYRPPGASFSMVGSFWDSIDNVLIDPDAENIDEAKWIARKMVKPCWEVEDTYGLPRGTLKGHFESSNSKGQHQRGGVDDYERRNGRTNDLCEYWCLYSKMGVGTLMKDLPQDMRDQFSEFGPYVYLVVCDGVPYPLNLSPGFIETADDDAIFNAAQWPTPFWVDNRWPCSFLAFHHVPRKVWGMSHMQPAIGELRFLNWAFSHLATKIRITSRDFIAILKAAGENVRNTILKGKDLELIEIESSIGGAINHVVQFLQHPPLGQDLFAYIQMVMHLLEQRLGLPELLYGMSSVQLRSAEEARTKQQNVNIRPQDMADQVEEFCTDVARHEGIAARWNLTAADVSPVLGPSRAAIWEQVMMQTPLEQIARELEYRIEAGSARKPNRQRDQDNINMAMQTVGPLLQQMMTMNGDVRPLTALLQKWAVLNDLAPEDFVLQPPLPPPMPAPGEGGPPAEAPPQPAAA